MPEGMVVEQVIPAAFQQAAGIARARFYVELKAGETTFVSWKKLTKDFQKVAPPLVDPPLGAHPALQARIAPEVVAQADPLPPPANRFNSVIEKIERIYKGDDSTDENDLLNDFPDDDQYDTEDSFIDDRELDEYFSVDKAKLRHEGFFVNRGKLEWEADAVASAETVPKKRKRRDIKQLSLEADEVKQSNAGVKSKAAARKNTKSLLRPSNPSDKELFALAVPSKQAAWKRKKDAQDCFPRHAEVKPIERSIGEHVQRISRGCDSVLRLNVNDTDMTKADQALSAASRELQLMDSSDWDEFQREATMSRLSKLKPAHKGSTFEARKETSGGIKLENNRSSPLVGKEISPLRPKGAAWERAFQDLERAVGQSCPPSLISQQTEQGKRNNLPDDVKEKLAKVARLAVKQGQLTDELIDRLMGIVGHVVRVKTLKKSMKEMIETGVSAMQEKEGRVQDIKREVTEMVKSRVHSLQAQDTEECEFPSDGLQPGGGAAEKPEGRYRWDHATEDKICDLYEQFIEGLEENRGPQIRKLYGELAELWPDGWMDNNGIKHAVQRAKERKKKQSKASIVKSDTKKRQRSSGKQGESEGVRFPLLDLNLPGTNQSSFDKGKTNTALQSLLSSNFVSPLHVFEGLKNNYSIRHPTGTGVASVEKKRRKMEGASALKKKVKRKLEKGSVMLSSNHAQLSTQEYSIWKTGIQPLVALPARPLQQPRESGVEQLS